MQKPATPFDATTSWNDLSNQRPRPSPCKKRRAASADRGLAGAAPVSRTSTRIARSTLSRKSRLAAEPRSRCASRASAHVLRPSEVSTPSGSPVGAGSSTIRLSARSRSAIAHARPSRSRTWSSNKRPSCTTTMWRLSGYRRVVSRSEPGMRVDEKSRVYSRMHRGVPFSRSGSSSSESMSRFTSRAAPTSAAARTTCGRPPPVSANPGLTLIGSGVGSPRYQSSQNGSSQLSGADTSLQCDRRCCSTPPGPAASTNSATAASVDASSDPPTRGRTRRR